MKICCALLMTLIVSTGVTAADPETAIKETMSNQVEAWNRGDIPTFVASYADDCTFVGKEVLHGRDQVLARYKKNYPTSDAMGTLVFSNLTVHRLDKQVAVAIGQWHLERGSAGGGSVGGIFSLVFELHKGQWLIALDHTT